MRSTGRSLPPGNMLSEVRRFGSTSWRALAAPRQTYATVGERDVVADLMTGVESAVLVEGVKFLYQQAGEILRGWRERHRDPDAPAPSVIEPPASIHVVRADPLPGPMDPEMRDTLQELKDLVEPIRDGVVDPDAAPAREVVANLRDLLEAVMRSPITFDGEARRTVEVGDVSVVVKRVAGQVTGVRVAMAKLTGSASIRHVHMQSDEVEPGGDVTAVDLT